MKKTVTISWILLCLLPSFSQGQITIENVQIEQVEGNVLRYNVSFTTNQTSTAYLEYGVGLYTNLSTNTMEHELVLIGLEQLTTYELKIHAFNGSGAVVSGPYSINTRGIPSDIVEAADSIYNDSSVTSGYILTDARGPDIATQVRIFNRSGKLVWYDYTKEIGSPCIGNNYSNRNTSLQIYGDCQTMIEIDLFGDTIQKVDISNIPGNFQIHHDMYINDVGNLVLLVAEGQAVDKSSAGGRADAIVVGDGYLEIAPNGEIISQWSIFDHLDPLNSRDAGAFWDQIFGEPAEDWTHANSIAQDVDGHYLMSLNALDQAIKIHRETGEILWTFGKNGDFTIDPPDALFKNQHTFWGIGNNRYTVFDNQGAGSFSRGMEFELDTVSRVASLVFIQDADSLLSTGIVGSTYKLDNGNMLSSFGRAGAIQEVDSTGKVVWYRNEGTILNYRSFFVPYLYPPLADLQLLDTVFCQDDRPLIPKTSLVGGYFEGPGFENGQLNPALLSPGDYELVYHYAYLSDTFQFTIQSSPERPVITQVSSYLITEAEGLLQWFLDGQAIEGATTDSLTINANGTYQLQITSGDGCSAFSNSIVIGTVATEEADLDQLVVFPNPNRGAFEVQFGQLEVAQVQIFDLLGRMVYRRTPLIDRRLHIKGIPVGTYSLVVRTLDGGIIRRQVVVGR